MNENFLHIKCVLSSFFVRRRLVQQVNAKHINKHNRRQTLKQLISLKKNVFIENIAKLHGQQQHNETYDKFRGLILWKKKCCARKSFYGKCVCYLKLIFLYAAVVVAAAAACARGFKADDVHQLPHSPIFFFHFNLYVCGYWWLVRWRAAARCDTTTVRAPREGAAADCVSNMYKVRYYMCGWGARWGCGVGRADRIYLYKEAHRIMHTKKRQAKKSAARFIFYLL